MTTKQHVIEELSVGPARVRVDYHGTEPRAHILEDMDFFNYRLADVHISSEPSLAQPDIVWNRDAETSVSYDGHAMTFNGEWAPGPLQKAGVAMLALRLEEHGLHPFHASAVRYRDRTVMFLGGESNHGKSMCQIESCRRGASLVSTETTVVDEASRAVMGSKTVFIKKRAQGTERADKAAPDRAVEIFFGSMPTWEVYEEPSTIDVVVVPAIDGNFDPSLAEMIDAHPRHERTPPCPRPVRHQVRRATLLHGEGCHSAGADGPARQGPLTRAGHAPVHIRSAGNPE